MTADTSKKMVMVSIIATSAAVGISFFKNSDRKPGDGFKTAWALGALFMILSIGSDVAPEIAGPLALLVLVSAVLYEEGTLNGVLHIVPPPKAPAKP